MVSFSKLTSNKQCGQNNAACSQCPIFFSAGVLQTSAVVLEKRNNIKSIDSWDGSKITAPDDSSVVTWMSISFSPNLPSLEWIEASSSFSELFWSIPGKLRESALSHKSNKPCFILFEKRMPLVFRIRAYSLDFRFLDRGIVNLDSCSWRTSLSYK